MKKTEIKFSTEYRRFIIFLVVACVIWVLLLLWNILLPVVIYCVMAAIFTVCYSARLINKYKNKLDANNKECLLMRNDWITKCRQITEINRGLEGIQISFDRIKKSSDEKINKIFYYQYLSYLNERKSEEYRNMAEMYKRKYDRVITPGLIDDITFKNKVRKNTKKKLKPKPKKSIIVKKKINISNLPKPDKKILSARNCNKPVSSDSR